MIFNTYGYTFSKLFPLKIPSIERCGFSPIGGPGFAETGIFS